MAFPLENIRNFCIVAHIDHGKSTLADRLLELTQSVAERDMEEQLPENVFLTYAGLVIEWDEAGEKK